MNEMRETLIEKIKYIPDDKLYEAINFIDFLTEKKTQGILLSLSGSLSGMPVSSEEIDKELYGEMSGGAGDYTKMRREYFQNLTVKDILDDMRSEGFIDVSQ